MVDRDDELVPYRWSVEREKVQTGRGCSTRKQERIGVFTHTVEFSSSLVRCERETDRQTDRDRGRETDRQTEKERECV